MHKILILKNFYETKMNLPMLESKLIKIDSRLEKLELQNNNPIT